MRFRIAGIAGLAGFVAAAHGQAFDWQSVAGGTYTGSVTMANGGNTVVVSPIGAADPRVVVTDPGVVLLGTLSGAAFDDPVAYGNNRGQYWDFVTALSSVTFLFGDAGGDDDGYVTIDAYDASDTFLGGGSVLYGTSASGDSMTLSFAGMDHFRATGGGAAPGSLFFEVSASTMVPEPASVAVLGLGALLAIRRRRR